MRYFVFLYAVCSGLYACPNGYDTLGNGDCYKTFSNPSLQREAEVFCEQEGGTLVQPLNAFVDAKLRSEATNTNSNLWLGMTCLENTTTSCTYSNGDSVTTASYTNFYPGHPNPDIGNCVYLSIGSENGKWISGNCTEQSLGFGCQLTAESFLPNYVPKCGTSYQAFGEFCYKTIFLTRPREGESACQLECGHLTSIHSQRENDFILNLSLPHGNDTVHIGLKPNNQIYEWTDGSTPPFWDYNNFARNKPCGYSLKPFVIPFPSVSPTCPAPYELTGNGTIYSPGYPSNYSDNLRCEYYITAPLGSVVFFNWNGPDCSDHDSSMGNFSLYYSITDNVPFINWCLFNYNNDHTFYASTNSSMKMTFSSGSDNRYTWIANYTSVDIRSSGCNQGVLQTPGTLTSPNYGSNFQHGHYPSDYHCTYQLEAPSNKRIFLLFESCDIYIYDRINVYDSPDISCKLLFGADDWHNGFNVTSTSNHLFVVFDTDYVDAGRGFTATFTAI